MKKVLVMLSTYNGEKYLRTQIDSVLSQENVKVEILIRDDGSSDRTLDIIKSIDKDNIQFKTGNHEGVYESFFSLIHAADLQWDYYAFCDQDDFWESDKLKSAIALLEQFEKNSPALYYSGQKVTDENLNIIYNHKINISRSTKANYIFNQAAGCTTIFNQNFMKILKHVHPQNLDVGHEVWCCKLCAAISGKIIVESEGHILYRQHENNCIGLRNSLTSKIAKFNQYYLDCRPSQFANVIIKNYKDFVNDSWNNFLENITYAAAGNWHAKLKLLLSKDIRFNNPVLHLIFILKVVTGNI